MRLAPLAFVAALFTAPVTATAADVYAFDPGHTQVRASWNHAGYSEQSLHFRQIDGSVSIDLENPAATRIEVIVPIASLDTGVDALDNHLRAADFFGVQQHPNATFISTSVEKTGEKTLKVVGELTIKDISRPITLDVVVNNIGAHPLGQFAEYYHGEWIGVTVIGQILRSEWGLGMFAPITSDEVQLFISTEMKAG